MAGMRPAQPKMSMRVLLESLGLGQYYKFFSQAGMSMIDGGKIWTDLDVEDLLNGVERRTGYIFAAKERILLWKALRLMWARGPGHDCPFIQPAEVPALFLPKRDWRQMDSDVKYNKLEPDRQRQIIRRKTVMRGGKGLMELQFEVYLRQQDIFYQLKDVSACIAVWMKADPRKMLREDPREEAMKLRIRTMMDAAAGFLQVRKKVIASNRNWAIFFLFCRILLMSTSMLMFIIGYVRYGGSPPQLQNKFWMASGQFRSGTAFFMAYWVAYLVADRAKEDSRNKRFQRIIIALERLMEEISSFRVETDHIRMEEHEAVQRNESAQIAYDQSRNNKVEVAGKPKKRRRKKVDTELNAWAPGVKFDNMEEFKLKTQKAIEESYKRLPALPDNFRRNGGDRMIQFEDKGLLGGVTEHTRHIKAPWQMNRGEARPAGEVVIIGGVEVERAIPVAHPEERAMPATRRAPVMAPSRGAPDFDARARATGAHSIEDLRHNAFGDSPPSGPSDPGSAGGLGRHGEGGWGSTDDMWRPDDDVPPRYSMRDSLEALRSASDSLPGSRARTRSPEGDPGFSSDEWMPPDFPSGLAEELPEVPPLEPLVEPAAAPKAARSRRRGSKDVREEAEPDEQQAAMRLEAAPEATDRSDLRDAGAAGEPSPLPPPEEGDLV